MNAAPLHSIPLRWFGVAIVSVAALAVQAQGASITLASAEMGPAGQVSGTPINASKYIGWRFRVTKTMAVTEVGGHVGGLNGELFAAIVSLTALDALPQGAPFADGTVKASTTFLPPAPTAEFHAPLAVTLQAGTYALVIGSGKFGATGNGVASSVQQPNILPTTQASYIFWEQSVPNVFNWTVGSANNLRFIVTGAELTSPADFNLDGTVNALDLPVWKAGFGNPAPAGTANGDANADGKVDGADFLVWQQAAAASAAVPTASTVPEPAAGKMGAALLSVGFAARRRTSVGCG
ncbi:dockerin type I domain-containing protein [Lacipirellula sp.]|uniref:dockerin type I domain-containing protein n=1 Tax=Lacipirellula sp. TaxID=2691419 RepID=UPI003D0F423F